LVVRAGFEPFRGHAIYPKLSRTQRWRLGGIRDDGSPTERLKSGAIYSES
jgi:hypothetical protein